MIYVPRQHMLERATPLIVTILLMLAVLTACAAPTDVDGSVPAATAPAVESPPTEAATETSASAAKEAPSLAARVAAGELPPLEERLPLNPMVVTPHQEIGQYGGTWRMGLLGGNDNDLFNRSIGYEPMLRWTPEWDGWIPNVAESIEANESATEYTIRLREGMRWSDGVPFTADDIMFWYEDIALNTEITPIPSGRLTVEGEFVKVEKIDDYTVKAIFAAPFGFFPLRLAQGEAFGDSTPKHYLQQFHVDYNPNVVAEAEAAGFASWGDYFQQKADVWANAEIPRFDPWLPTRGYGEVTDLLVAERNPYYWKVDPDGKQLPYIDRVEFTIANSADVLTLKALNGEIDMQSRHIGVLANKPVFFDNQDAGNYRFFDLKSSWGNAVCFNPNLTNQDPVMNEIINNKDFRIGLSHAINRQEIIDLVFVGQAEPAQFAPLLDSPFANEQMRNQYLEYDVDLANEYLDKAGLTERDSEGFRLRPDGQRLTLGVEVAAARTDDVAVAELVVDYWDRVGVDASLMVLDRSLQWEHKAANQFDVFVWPAGGGGGLDVILNTQSYFPDRDAAWYAPPWGTWFATNGEQGEEPDEPMKQMMTLYWELQQKPTLEEQIDLMNQIIQISADYFPTICISTQPDLYGIVKNDMLNVPDSMIQSATYPDPAPTNPEQYFFKRN